jgi:hypothetical protein
MTGSASSIRSVANWTTKSADWKMSSNPQARKTAISSF